MKKPKLRYGYRLISCPICKANTFDYCSYSEEFWGASVTAEQHGFCLRCGYCVEQAYSSVIRGFCDIKKGFKRPDGIYVPKDTRKHKRIRRKRKIKGIEINPVWAFMV